MANDKDQSQDSNMIHVVIIKLVQDCFITILCLGHTTHTRHIITYGGGEQISPLM